MSESFASRFKAARKEAGFSQYELAKMLNVATQTISTYECRNSLPPLKNAALIAKRLGVSLDWLVGNDVYSEARTDADIFCMVEQLENRGIRVVLPDEDCELVDALKMRKKIKSMNVADDLKDALYSAWRDDTLEQLRQIRREYGTS